MEIRYSATVDGPLALYADAAGYTTFSPLDAQEIGEGIAERGGRAQLWDGPILLHEYFDHDDGPERLVGPVREALHRSALTVMEKASRLRGFNFAPPPRPDCLQDFHMDFYALIARWGRVPDGSEDMPYPRTHTQLFYELRRGLPSKPAELALIFLFRALLEPDDTKAQRELLDAQRWIERAEEARYAAPEPAAEVEPGL